MSKQNNLTHLETLVVSIQKSFASSVNSNYLIPTNRFASTTISNEPKNSANNNAEKRYVSIFVVNSVMHELGLEDII